MKKCIELLLSTFLIGRAKQTLFIMVVVAVGVGAAAISKKRGLENPVITTHTSPAQGNRKLPPRIGGAEITLDLSGFSPKEIRRKQEPFILSIRNLTELQDLSFKITRDRGEGVSDKKPSKGQVALRQLLDLKPGEYILTEENHPKWVSRITIIDN